MSDGIELSSGSQWRRWEPHIHAPGTVLNDQFKGTDRWEQYLSDLESKIPAIEALGITDYYCTETYARLRDEKAKGRLPRCKLLFPNIEMRLGVGTPNGNWVNIHLLVRPDDPAHLEKIHLFLESLEFRAHQDRFTCAPASLIRLGKMSGLTDDRAALEEGSKQFKVGLDNLRDRIEQHAWIRENTFLAVSGQADGTSDLRGAEATLRQEIERMAHVMFVSNPKSRDFWLGRTEKASKDSLQQSHGGCKPCLHGSDAHTNEDIGQPALNRYSWIKGDPTFDALHQAVIDPERAYVGEDPPSTASPSQVISSVKIVDATWVTPTQIPLNPGLVAIIGARGSGKTALAELIAAGCDAIPREENTRSFLYRARDFLRDTDVNLTWANGDTEVRPVAEATTSAHGERARYLSQQFVDHLCASDGVTDELLREVERVVFDSHKLADRDGAIDFDDLRTLRASRFRRRREHEEETLGSLSETIGEERDKHASITMLAAQQKEKEGAIERLTQDRSKLVKKGGEAIALRLEALNTAANKVRGNVRYFVLREQDLLGLKDEVHNMKDAGAPADLRDLRSRHQTSGFKDAEWDSFLLDYKGPVVDILGKSISSANKDAADWRGKPPATIDVSKALIAADADLNNQTLSLLEAEIERLNKIVAIDKATADKFADLTTKIAVETEHQERIKEKLKDANGAKARITGLVTERQQSYARVFDAIASEQSVLDELYAPIKAKLAGAGGTLGKLSFSVVRTVDLDQWALAGEQFVDLRREGPFRKKGTLRGEAEKHLMKAWEKGDAAAATKAMEAFRKENDEDLIAHARVQKSNVADFRTWTKRFAKWLYSTDHISIHYSVDYDGIDIRNLSPGTRGIVLLLLYLALDDSDDRPLIIDQPEENLDPKSIFDELVSLFQLAKTKRQVIMVTHNANLVVNADADQIIVAKVGTHVAGLPPISYAAGGLDDKDIREAVCDILEGGERAFRERARRLRVARW